MELKTVIVRIIPNKYRTINDNFIKNNIKISKVLGIELNTYFHIPKIK